jgi:hypothetical protein
MEITCKNIKIVPELQKRSLGNLGLYMRVISK